MMTCVTLVQSDMSQRAFQLDSSWTPIGKLSDWIWLDLLGKTGSGQIWSENLALSLPFRFKKNLIRICSDLVGHRKDLWKSITNQCHSTMIGWSAGVVGKWSEGNHHQHEVCTIIYWHKCDKYISNKHNITWTGLHLQTLLDTSKISCNTQL